MFKKRRCTNCGKKIETDFSFCPHCGNEMEKRENNEDFGMLGKDDNFFDSFDNISLPFGFNTIFNSLIKNLDKQLKSIDKGIPQNQGNKKINKNGININISTSDGLSPKVVVKSFGNAPKLEKVGRQTKEKTRELPSLNLPEEKIKKMSKLPKKEPATKIRRLSNKVIYEIDMPGVESIKDISIIRLENSIETKALAKTNVYIKLIPISLPIINYNLSDGKLILELEAKD